MNENYTLTDKQMETVKAIQKEIGIYHGGKHPSVLGVVDSALHEWLMTIRKWNEES